MDAKNSPQIVNIDEQCFNPRARDGREMVGFFDLYRNAVSIHAPVMDAKPFITPCFVGFWVSIHAPVMDAKAF